MSAAIATVESVVVEYPSVRPESVTVKVGDDGLRALTRLNELFDRADVADNTESISDSSTHAIKVSA